MPRAVSHYNFSPDRMPFDFPEVLAAIAPRAVFIVAPLHDDNFAVEGVRDCVKAANPIYRLFDHAERLKVIYPDTGHDFPDAARDEASAFFGHVLNWSRRNESRTVPTNRKPGKR
ncbi:MAG: hypothetical protein WD738_14670 [Pirellulales bacterium]